MATSSAEAAQADACTSWRDRRPHSWRKGAEFAGGSSPDVWGAAARVPDLWMCLCLFEGRESKGHHGALFAVVNNRDSALFELRGAKFAPVHEAALSRVSAFRTGRWSERLVEDPRWTGALCNRVILLPLAPRSPASDGLCAGTHSLRFL